MATQDIAVPKGEWTDLGAVAGATIEDGTTYLIEHHEGSLVLVRAGAEPGAGDAGQFLLPGPSTFRIKAPDEQNEGIWVKPLDTPVSLIVSEAPAVAGAGGGGGGPLTDVTSEVLTMQMAEGNGSSTTATGENTRVYTRTITALGLDLGIALLDPATDLTRVSTPVRRPENVAGWEFVWETLPSDGSDPEIIDNAIMLWGPTNVEGDHSTRSQVTRLFSANANSTTNSVLVYWEPNGAATDSRLDRLQIRKASQNANFPESIVRVRAFGHFYAAESGGGAAGAMFTMALRAMLRAVDVVSIQSLTFDDSNNMLTLNYMTFDDSGNPAAATKTVDLSMLVDIAFTHQDAIPENSEGSDGDYLWATASDANGLYYKAAGSWSLIIPTGTTDAASVLSVLTANSVTEPSAAAVAADRDDYFVPLVDDTGSEPNLERLTITRLVSEETMFEGLKDADADTASDLGDNSGSRYVPILDRTGAAADQGWKRATLSNLLSQDTLYDAVKAMLEHNDSVTPDDADKEFDITGGSGGGGGSSNTGLSETWVTATFAAGMASSDPSANPVISDEGTAAGIAAAAGNDAAHTVTVPNVAPGNTFGLFFELVKGNDVVDTKSAMWGVTTSVAPQTPILRDQATDAKVNITYSANTDDALATLQIQKNAPAADFPAMTVRVRGIGAEAVSEKLLAIFWGLEQTQRTLDKRDYTEDRIGVSLSNGVLRLRWLATGPSEVLRGSNDGDIVDVAAAVPTGADLVTGEGSDQSQQAVFPDQFIALAGGDDGRTFKINLNVETGASSDSTFGGWLYRVDASGDDKALLAKSEGYGGLLPDPLEIIASNSIERPGQDVNFATSFVTVPANETYYLTAILTSLRMNSGNGEYVGAHMIVEEL